MLCAIDLDIFMPYALKEPLLTKNHLIILSRGLKGMAKTQFEDDIWDFHNQVLEDYDDESTWEILGRKKIFDLLKEKKFSEDRE